MRGRSRAAQGFLLLGMVAALPVLAQWEFVPAAELRTIGSDNLQLQGGEERQSDLIGVINPSFSLSREDDTVDVDLNYSLEAVGYLQADDVNQIFQQIDAGLEARLLGDHLLLGVGGDLFQQVVDPENPFINNNVAVTGNRTDALGLNASATWRQSVGGVADLQISHAQTRLDFDRPELFDSDIASSNLRLASRQSEQGITWAASANLDRVEFGNGLSEAEFSVIQLELGYWVTSGFRVFATSGVESDFLEHRSEIEYDTFIWSAGIDWQVAERDQLTLSYGQRAFGDNLRASWSHQLGEKLRFNIDYSETPSTNPQASRLQLQQLGLFIDNELPGDQVGLDRPGSADSFVRRRLSTGISANGNRLGLSLTGYFERRTDRVNGFGVPVVGVEDEESRGVRANARWDVGVKTGITVGANWELADFVGTGEVERLTLFSTLSYSLGTRTNLSLEYRRFDGDGQAQEFVENRLTFIIGRRFL
ncbi:MAG: TIGR03016 family PEP-CTERM system-associated outer membrane protein [Pseudomonadota bacterium]